GGAVLRETEQGQPGIGVTAQLVALTVGVLSAIEISPQPHDLADLVAAFSHDAGVDVGDVPANPLGFVLSLRPGTADLHHLGPMDPADALVQDRGRDSVAPVRRRLGPRCRPADVTQLVAGGHEVAVDVAGPQRRKAFGRRLQYAFVEQRRALLRPTE